MSSVTPTFKATAAPTAVRLACLLLVGTSLTACSSIENMFSSDKVDYRSGARQTTGLDVPPDLTQLARDGRAQVQGGVVSASAMQQASTTAKPSAGSMSKVALDQVGDLRIERSGEQRWLRSSLTPEQLWPQVRGFWLERGFELASEQTEVGVMETNWAENRAKLPQDLIRSTIGKVLDGLYSTGERDKFRTRLERVNGGTEIYVSHRGMVEVYTNNQRDNTAWQPRPADPQLEAEMLSRLMLKLGAKDEQAKAVLAAAPAAPAKGPATAAVHAGTRALADVPTSLQVNEGFERAWRRVGQSLDRHGFTVEDRDRKQGLFFLRYADPNEAGKDEPNFFSKLFGGDKGQTAARYRVSVKSEGERSTVMVLDDKGQQQTGEIAKRILNLLMDDLR